MSAVADMTREINALGSALSHFVAAFDDSMTADNLAPSMTCREVDAIARILALAADRNAAELWVAAHRDNEYEDEGDTHYELDDLEIAEYVTALLEED